VNAAIRQIDATMPAAPPPPMDDRAVIAGLVRTFARFRTLPFIEQRAMLKRVVRGFHVVDGAIPEFTLSGEFLADMAHTNSAQPLTALCNFGVPADIVLALPEPIRLRVQGETGLESAYTYLMLCNPIASRCKL
jgi:hypothetical protein